MTANSIGTVEDIGTEMLNGTQMKSPIPKCQEIQGEREQGCI